MDLTPPARRYDPTVAVSLCTVVAALLVASADAHDGQMPVMTPKPAPQPTREVS
jgi:hypothetical protein